MLRARKAKKGLSGAVTALILVIASVIIALVVVGFAFNLFGTFGGTPEVQPAGTASLTYIGSDQWQLTVPLTTTGTVNITSVTIPNPTGFQLYKIEPSSTINAGTTTLTIYLTNTTPVSLLSGHTYTATLGLSDGATVQVAFLYQS